MGIEWGEGGKEFQWERVRMGRDEGKEGKRRESGSQPLYESRVKQKLF